MTSFRSHRSSSQSGFSLPEIMVGMVIGMLGIIIIMQVTSVFESRKRTTSSGDDAQNGGAIALFSLQRDISQAGYGISSPLLIGRSLVTTFITLNPLTPVTINPPALAGIGASGSDRLVMLYGNSSTVEGGWITNPTATLPYQIALGTGQRVLGDGGRGFHVGDWVIPSQSGVTATHNMYQVVPSAASDVVAVSGVPPALSYIPTNPDLPLLFNMGPNPSLLAYAVVNGALSVCDYRANNCGASTSPAIWLPVAGDVVSFRAICESPVSIRIALVTRNVQFDPAIVTPATPVWHPAGVNQVVVANPTTAWGTNWGHYRYKVFESIYPIRNSIWAGVQGCL